MMVVHQPLTRPYFKTRGGGGNGVVPLDFQYDLLLFAIGSEEDGDFLGCEPPPRMPVTRESLRYKPLLPVRMLAGG